MFEPTKNPDDRDALLAHLAAQVRAARPPADLQATVDEAVAARLAKAPGWRRVRRPGLLWAAVLAAAAVAFLLVATPGREAIVFADVIDAFGRIESVRAEGWFRGEDGARVPCRLWARDSGDVRMEYGPEAAATTVVAGGGRHLVILPDGRRLVRQDGPRWRPGFDQALRTIFATYDDPETWHGHWESARADLGDVERFTYRGRASLGHHAGFLRHILDVDKATRLPLRAEVHELRDGRWWPLSELRYADYNVPPAAELFVAGPGPGGEVMTADDEAAQWFALGVGPASLHVPAVLVPQGGLEVEWLDPDVPEYEGMGSGASVVAYGGVETSTFVRMPLGTVVQSLSRMPTLPGEAARQPVSVRVRAKAALPWEVRTRGVLARLGVAAQETTVTETATRLVFMHDGRTVAPSTEQFPRQSVRAGQDGYHFEFARQPLSFIVERVLGNSRHDGALAGPYVVEFAAGERARADVFETLVDAEFSNPTSRWEDGLKHLQQEFGVHWRVETMQRESRQIVLR
ncbi:MAG: hypothetical protein IH621_07830 [Krumholzibacteria bacterium]|nr:hypothetical protein [Candidatus Krumholzibacteria bacterium]